jgi:hypothetical protein
MFCLPYFILSLLGISLFSACQITFASEIAVAVSSSTAGASLDNVKVISNQKYIL